MSPSGLASLVPAALAPARQGGVPVAQGQPWAEFAGPQQSADSEVAQKPSASELSGLRCEERQGSFRRLSRAARAVGQGKPPRPLQAPLHDAPPGISGSRKNVAKTTRNPLLSCLTGGGWRSPRRGIGRSRRRLPFPSPGLRSPGHGMASPAPGLRFPAGGLRYPGPGLRYPMEGLLNPSAGLRYPGAGLGFPPLGLRNPCPGLGFPPVGMRNPDPGSRNPRAGKRSPAPGLRFPRTGLRFPAVGLRFPRPGERFPRPGPRS